MFKARYLVEAHVLEGRPVAELAAAYGVHRSWIYKLLARYREGGLEALEPRSRRPRSSPAAISTEAEEAILRLRRELQSAGHDAGAYTIAAHLASELEGVPSPSTIWRVLKRHGLIVPQPQKRPICSRIRFEAELPNEMWQTDITHLGARRRAARGDPQPDRRPLQTPPRLRRLPQGQSHRRRRHLPQDSPATRPALLAALRQRRGLHRLFPTRKGALGARAQAPRRAL